MVPWCLCSFKGLGILAMKTGAKKKQSVSELDHVELRSKSTDERFSLSAILTDSCGFKDLFVHHEIIPAGRRSSSPHAHSRREEMIYVLSGTVIAHCGSQVHELGAGDFFGFKPGTLDTHYVENRSAEEARILVIATNPKGDEVVYGKGSVFRRV